MSGGGGPSVPGTPLLLITNVPQQVVGGSSKGVTLINPSALPIVLSTDAIPTSSNSFTLPPNGASLPIANGPLWASITSSGMATLNVFPGILNVFNPNVLANPPTNIPFYNKALTASAGGIATDTNIAVPPSAKTLIVQLVMSPTAITTMQIEGGTTGFFYYQQHPYLSNGAIAGAFGWNIICPYNSVLDPVLNISLNGLTPAQVVTVTIQGDTAQYKEDVFYNGTMKTDSQAIATATTTNFVTGPTRLLTATLGAGGATFAQLLQASNGKSLLTAPGTAGSNVGASVSFPPNTILPSGDSIGVSSNAAGPVVIGGITHAYP